MTEEQAIGLGILIALAVFLTVIVVVCGALLVFGLRSIGRVQSFGLERRGGRLQMTGAVAATSRVDEVLAELELAQAQDAATRARSTLLPATNGARTGDAPS